MTHAEKEMDLAKRYLDGDCNEIQFNYMLQAQGLDRERVERLVDELAYSLPLARAAKIMLLYIMFMSLFCLFCSILRGF